MPPSELIIIYLTIGAPFAVHSITVTESRPVVTRGLVFLATWLIWPVKGATLAAERFRLRADASSFVTRGHLDARITENVAFFRSRLAAEVRGSLTGSQRFHLDEAVERYLGLSSSLVTDADASSEAEVFAVAGHPNAKLATACLNRRNRNRTARHRTKAAREIVELLTCIGNGSGYETDSMSTFAGLAGELQDEETLQLIRQQHLERQTIRERDRVEDEQTWVKTSEISRSKTETVSIVR